MQNPNEEDEEDEEATEDWVNIGTYHSLDKALDHALVTLAIGKPARVDRAMEPGKFDLQTDADGVERVIYELQEYTSETEARVMPRVLPANWRHHSAGAPYILLWITGLLAVFYFQMQHPSLSDHYASSSIGLIKNREYWRPLTGLFLHADGPHIVGNLVSGTVFAALVSKCLGPVKGWLLIFLSGAAGNALTSFVTYPEPFIYLGASTAVFGALGLLSGIGLIENIRQEVRLPWVRVLAPLLAGLILLGWLGGAEVGSHTDVFGHVFGFAAGCIFGALTRYVQREPNPELQKAPFERR